MNIYPAESEIKYIRESLNKFNNEKVEADCHTPLNIIEYDENGNIIGGILGGTYWGWMHIDILWVHENHRNKGIGSKLLKEAEKEAVRRGCHHVHVDTMSWQAPDFCKKHGRRSPFHIIRVLFAQSPCLTYIQSNYSTQLNIS